MSFSVVIPSRSIDNLRPCVAAVRECEPAAEIVVVDDGLECNIWSHDPAGMRISKGIKPFIFSRNVNLGIHEAFRNPVTYDCTRHDLPVLDDPNPDGVVLLNDDALLKTPGGFTRLAELAAQHEDIGIIAPVTNVTGQPLQMPKGVGLRQVPHIAFVCVYIPRRTIERVGMLDERYAIDYGVEDRDYCEAVNRAGLKVCVYDHVFVDHASLVSTFRGDPKTPRPFTENYKLFKQKWGIA